MFLFRELYLSIIQHSLYFMFNPTNYSANLTRYVISTNISIVKVNILIHIYMLSYNYAAVHVQTLYKQYYAL